MPKLDDDTAESSPADEKEADAPSTSEETVVETTDVAGEGSPPEKAAKPTAREKWFKKLTEGREEETPAETAEGETPKEETSETTEEETPAETTEKPTAPEARTSTLSDEEFLKRVKPETARRFRELADARKADRTEITRLQPLAQVGARIEKILADTKIPREHFDQWTDLGVRVGRGDKETAVQLFNMAVGLARDLGVELPIPKPSPTDHPAFQTLSKRLTAQVRAGTIAAEDADAILDEMKATLTPIPTQPAVADQRRSAAPQTREASPQTRQPVSLFSDPPEPPETTAALSELERKDKAMETVHGANWPEIQKAVLARLTAARVKAQQAGRTIHPSAFPDMFDQAVEAEVASRKAKAPVKPKVPPTLVPGRQTQKAGTGTTGKAKARSFLTGT